MAGEWIKMRVDLPTHPKVVRMASACKADRLRVVGGLLSVWGLFDVHSIDGQLEGYTPEVLDDTIGFPGFSHAMLAVGWLEFDGSSLWMPRFDEHNGQSAKKRGQDAIRKRNDRKTSAPEADTKRTREEKIREEEKITPPNPPGGKCLGTLSEKKAKVRAERMTLKTFLDRCKETGERPIGDYEPLTRYMAESGLSADFVNLCWVEFKREFLPGGKSERKQQALWRRHFQNFVERNFYRLWYAKPTGDGVAYELTTVGLQAQMAAQRREAA